MSGPVYQVFAPFLPTGTRLRGNVARGGKIGNRGKRSAFGVDRLAQFALPTDIPLCAKRIELAIFNDGGGLDQAMCHCVDPADVAVEQIGGVDRLAAYFGIEIEPASREPARTENFQHRQCQFFNRIGELVGVPAVLVIAPVGIDGSKDAKGARHGDLVLERVASERRVVGLDIDLDLVFQTKAPEEAIDCLRVEIILVLGRFVRFGLDQNRAGKADPVLVIDHQLQKSAEVFLFDADIGVENGVVSFAAAPQHVIGPAKAMRCFERVAHLAGGKGEHLRIRIGCRACHIALVAEQVGGPPQQFATVCRLKFLQMIDRTCKTRAEIADAFSRRHHVDIVEAVKRHIEFLHKRQRRFALGTRCRFVLRACEPWPVERARAKHIATRPAERVPETHGKAQVVFQTLAHDHAVLVVPAIGKVVGGFGPLVTDRVERCEIVG